MISDDQSILLKYYEMRVNALNIILKNVIHDMNLWCFYFSFISLELCQEPNSVKQMMMIPECMITVHLNVDYDNSAPEC